MPFIDYQPALDNDSGDFQEKSGRYPCGLAIGNESFEPGKVTNELPAGLRAIFAISYDFLEFGGPTSAGTSGS